MSIKVISETPVAMAELKEELARVKERDSELNFRASKAEEYLNNFCTIDAAKSKELKEKLLKLEIPRMREEHLVKIVDILPATPEEVKSVLQGYTMTVSQENIKKIADIVSGYIGKKK